MTKINTVKNPNTKDLYRVEFNGKFYYFYWNPLTIYQLDETFKQIPYDPLDCKDKIVIDVGSNIGDTAIFFIAQGAKKVYGFDNDHEMWKVANENVRLNKLTDKIEIYEFEVKDIEEQIMFVKEPGPLVLKMDCEGCERKVFENDHGSLKKFEEIILEYHVDPYFMMSRLFSYGFFDLKKLPRVDSLGTYKNFGYIISGKKHVLE